MQLTEVDGNVDDNEYTLRPYGLLLLKMESETLARKACDALELHMRKHKQAVVADEGGLFFTDAPVELDFAIVTRAILWRDYTDTEIKARAAKELEEAVDAARRFLWAQRREQS